MINVDKTLLSTLRVKIDDLRFLAQNDTQGFKKILTVVILKDLLEWAPSMGEDECTMKKLSKKIDELILRNCEFTIERDFNTNNYVNVNTPQTIYTWQRIWDRPDVVYNKERETDISEHSFAYTPDPSCSPSFVYFDDYNEWGEPDIDRSKLTVCEKMDIYINRTTGEIWYLKEDGNWDTMKGSVDSIDWSKINNAPVIYQGIKHEVTDDNKIRVELLEEDYPMDEGIEMATEEDLEDVL